VDAGGPPSEFAAIYPRTPGERVAKQDLVGPPATAVAGAGPTIPPPEPLTPPAPVETPGVLPDIPVEPLETDPPLVHAIRAFLNDQPKLALEHFQSLDPVNQELMKRLVPALVQATRKNLAQASPNEVGMLVDQLDEATALLTPRASLYIEKACFCDDVKNFGRYKPLPEGSAFRPRALVTIYTEVRNVPSEPVTNPAEGEGFMTRLACSLEMRDAAGNVIEIELTDTSRKRVPKLQVLKEDFTRSRLKDYFIMLWFETPSRPGTYTVTFEVRDPKTGRAVSKPMSFRVQ
jgi:hypothetical protein